MKLAVLAVVCGLAVIVGLAVSMELDRRANFPGRENITRIVSAADAMSGSELVPVSRPVQELDDWFFMRGFEGFFVPAELAALPAMGARMIRFDGRRVAQVAVDRHSLLVYVFHAGEFGVEFPESREWRLVEHDGWTAALQRAGDFCVVAAFRGTSEEMREFLRTIQKPI